MFPVKIKVAKGVKLPLVQDTQDSRQYYARDIGDLPVGVYFNITEINIVIPEKVMICVFMRTHDKKLFAELGSGSKYDNPASGYKVVKLINDVEIFR